VEVPAVDSLFVSSELWQWERNLARIRRISRRTSGRPHHHESLVLKRARHHNFHDLANVSPIVGRWFGMLGHGDAAQMLTAVNETTLAFLELTALTAKRKEVPRECLAKTSGHYYECLVPMSHLYDDDDAENETPEQLAALNL
jgi:hypothetical protein